ncbi:hypothetical protein [Flindersiella endophytica]
MKTQSSSGQPAPPQAMRRDTGRPWVGRSYVHLVFPVPALDADRIALLDGSLAESGWQVVPDNRPAGDDSPILNRRWSNGQSVLLLVVLGWYPLLVTIGAEGSSLFGNSRVRKAERRLVEASVAAGAREVADRELDYTVSQLRARWPQAVAARSAIEEHGRWLECRGCRSCGAWSAYGALHCRGCARRFAPEDDSERNERGQAAAAATAAAEQQLRSLGRGDGLFAGWPAPRPGAEQLEAEGSA